MADNDIRDEHGNPIQLADQCGKPVQLTDEYGNPVHLTAVATTAGGGTGLAYAGAATAAAGVVHGTGVGGIGMAREYEEQHDFHGRTGVGLGGQTYEQQQQQLHRSGRSNSSSSEDDGQGGRRKKKGLKEKIKETLTGGKHRDKDEAAHSATTTVGNATSTATAPEHEKKGVMEKIKEKLPCHRH